MRLSIPTTLAASIASSGPAFRCITIAITAYLHLKPKVCPLTIGLTERFSTPIENYSMRVRAALDIIAKYGADSVCAIQEAKGRAIRIFSTSCPHTRPISNRI